MLSAELSESINSMFRWYAMAQVCYAYLEDVPYLDCGSNFIKSAWFTRGWTLQELLSPSRLVFYWAEWHEIGDRAELSDGVSSITGIGQRILCGRHHHRGVLDLSNVSIARRMSWASRRQTSREEDMSYSLLGIFGVSMNLLYGEGGKEAFRRLQEEIIKTSNDNSIFVWTQAEFRNPARLSALATTPLQFAPSSRIPIIRSSPTNLTTLTNEAINMLIYVKEFRSRHYGILKSHGPRSSLDFAIPLEMISPNTYIRLSGQVITLESNRICGAPVYASLVNRVGKYGEDSSRTAHIYSAITFQNIPSRFELLSVGCPTFDKSMGNDFSYRLTYTTDSTWVEILDHDEHRTWIFCIHPGLAGNELARLWREEWIYSSSSKTDFETAEMWGKRMAEQPIHHRHELGQSIRVRVHALQAMEPRSLFEKIQYYRHIYLKQNPGREKRQQPYPYKDCLFVDVRGKSTASFIEQGLLEIKIAVESMTHEIVWACRSWQWSTLVTVGFAVPMSTTAVYLMFVLFNFISSRSRPLFPTFISTISYLHSLSKMPYSFIAYMYALLYNVHDILLFLFRVSLLLPGVSLSFMLVGFSYLYSLAVGSGSFKQPR